jgi:hypothetical protein
LKAERSAHLAEADALEAMKHELEASKAERFAHLAEADALRAELTRLNEQLESILASRSWRYTSAMRKTLSAWRARANVKGISAGEIAVTGRKGSACVYTTLIGGYEKLNEQPVAVSSRLPFICLADDPNLRSQTWQIRQVDPLFGMDPIRSQRVLKLRPHEYLTSFDCSLYIDNSVILTAPPEQVIEQYLGASGFCLPEHSYRESVLDEFLEVERLGYDDQGRIFEQLNHYMLELPEVLQEKPFWTGVMLRNHRDLKVRTMLEIWSAHVQRYSRRDQLSVNFAFRRADLRPEVLRIDAFASWFHSWPNRTNSKQEKVFRLASTFHSLPVARIKELERQNEWLEQAIAEQTQAQRPASLQQELVAMRMIIAKPLLRYLEKAGLDESLYLEMYPDVRAEVEKGTFDSGLEHYIRYGMTEGRAFHFTAARWPEERYLRENPDVRAAVAAGQLSGLEHFVRFGQFEGRPFDPTE